MHVFVCMHRYLDDVSLHHLINALCSLSLEAMEMAYGNNKVEKLFLLFYYHHYYYIFIYLFILCTIFYFYP